jgi:hypothetical protein
MSCCSVRSCSCYSAYCHKCCTYCTYQVAVAGEHALAAAQSGQRGLPQTEQQPRKALEAVRGARARVREVNLKVTPNFRRRRRLKHLRRQAEVEAKILPLERQSNNCKTKKMTVANVMKQGLTDRVSTKVHNRHCPQAAGEQRLDCQL